MLGRLFLSNSCFGGRGLAESTVQRVGRQMVGCILPYLGSPIIRASLRSRKWPNYSFYRYIIDIVQYFCFLILFSHLITMLPTNRVDLGFFVS